MLEKMYTTKMSADKEKLQSRFAKIRMGSGRLSKVMGGVLLAVVILSIIIISLVVAMKTYDDYSMSNEEFADYISRDVGSIMAVPDYIDDDRLVFHYIDGFFVYDRDSGEMLHKINLRKLNVAGHSQGECFTVFDIDKDGKFAYLTNDGNLEFIKDFDNYIIDLETGAVSIGNKPEGTALFNNYADTFSTVPKAFGWASDRCIIDEAGRAYYLTTDDSAIAAIQLVIADLQTNDISKSYVFGDSYASLSQRKLDIIKTTVLGSNQEILTNSGCQWETDGAAVKAIIDKLSETRNIKQMDIKDGNYDVRTYDIWSNDKNQIMIFIFDNYSTELIFYEDISMDEHKFIVNYLNYPELPDKFFNPQDINNLEFAELVVGDVSYPIVVRDNLVQIEKMLSGAKRIKGGTACPFDAILILTKTDGVRGVVTLATDSCSVFRSYDEYYKYSDGDNEEIFGFFGLNMEEIIDMTVHKSD